MVKANAQLSFPFSLSPKPQARRMVSPTFRVSSHYSLPNLETPTYAQRFISMVTLDSLKLALLTIEGEFIFHLMLAILKAHI